jgi:hypothetical protein
VRYIDLCSALMPNHGLTYYVLFQSAGFLSGPTCFHVLPHEAHWYVTVWTPASTVKLTTAARAWHTEHTESRRSWSAWFDDVLIAIRPARDCSVLIDWINGKSRESG